MNLLSICLISSVFLFLFSMMSFFYGILFVMNNFVIFLEWEIFSLNSSYVLMTILLDWMSLIFMSFVTLISSMVILYSKFYMEKDLNMNRFILLVLLFVFSMILLIISPNLISILLGWDGLGLISYCLVIYYQNSKSYSAGMLTVLSNRIGDVMILMSISWMLNYGSWNYVFYLELMKNDYVMKIILMFVVIAAATKSAQIPFSSWLPAAMAAPTPVSALVHSSTLVTAGVYLLIRFNLVFQDLFVFKFFLLISILTMFMSGMAANYEFDLKKIIALSTLSQLGLMMSIMAMGYVNLAFFHLLTHALFKSLLFMCAGIIIHSMINNQDIRYMGNMIKFFPITFMCFMVSNLALCGMPFLSGFYSKDLILEIVSMSSLNLLIYFLYFFSTGLTVSYTFRLIYYSLISDYNMFKLVNFHDQSNESNLAMMTMMLMSMIGGSMLMWLLFPIPSMIFLFLLKKLLVLMVIGGGMIMGLMVIKSSLLNLNKSLYYFYFSVFFLGSMWFMPMLSTFGVNLYFLDKGKYFLKSLDFGWTEFLVSKMMAKNTNLLMKFFQMLQKNSFKSYIFVFYLMIISMILMFLISK
uniref:NADH dehydrogenase subunit 5 n=1 Tax=Psilochorema bidens TaxID=1968986 RepID=UPI0028D4AB38|nr:NADH dehydrogenase subunit 5 [Psilochorema bidens]WMQ76542.1 NADH dehydrogenase subunit 5 [Psilochorema bidens]